MKIFIGPLSDKTAFFCLIFLLFTAAGCRNEYLGAAKEAIQESELLGVFSYSENWLDISNETDNARASFWKPDGSTVYVVGRNTDNVVAYQLTDPWEIKTGKFLTETKVSGENQHGLYFREDGQLMWVFDRTGIWTYQLEESWDISTISEGEYTDLSSFVIRGHDIDFRPDGRVIYIDDRNKGAVFQVSLENPWDVTGYELQYTLDISDLQMEVRGVEFLNEGKAMALMDTGRKEILQYELGEAWDISTAVFKGGFDVSAQTHQGRGLSFSADETRFYVTGRDEQKIFQYHR